MGGEPAGEKAEKKPEKTGEKRRRAPEPPDPRLHVIYMEEESFTKKKRAGQSRFSPCGRSGGGIFPPGEEAEMGLSGLRSGKFCKIFPVRSLRGRKTLN